MFASVRLHERLSAAKRGLGLSAETSSDRLSLVTLDGSTFGVRYREVPFKGPAKKGVPQSLLASDVDRAFSFLWSLNVVLL